MHPLQGGRYQPKPRTFDANTLWNKIRGLSDQFAARAIETRAGTPYLAAGALGPEPDSSDETASKIAIQFNRHANYELHAAMRALIRFLLSSRGPVQTLRLVLAEPQLRRGRYLYRIPGLHDLRHALATTSAEHYAEAKALAECHSTSRLTIGSMVAYLFPDTDWWRKCGSHNGLMATCLVSDRRVCRRYLKSDWIQPGVFETLAYELGEPAVSHIAPQLQAYDPDRRKHAAKLLSWMPFDSAMAALLETESKPDVLGVLPALAERFPIRFLKLGIGYAGVDANIKHHILSVLSRHPQSAELARPYLKPNELEQLNALLEAIQPALETAPLASLHWVFSRPPWAERTKSKPKTFKLPAQSPPGSTNFSDEETHKLAPIRDELARLQSLSDTELRRTGMNRPWDWEPIAIAAALARGGWMADAATKVAKRNWMCQLRLRDYVASLLVAFPPSEVYELAFLVDADRRHVLTELLPLADRCMAQEMLEALGKKSMRQLATRWAVRHPEFAAASWLPVALGRRGNRERLASQGLRHIASNIGTAVIHDAAQRYGTEVVKATKALLTQDPLRVLAPKRPKDLGFCNPALIPPAGHKGRRPGTTPRGSGRGRHDAGDESHRDALRWVEAAA